MEITTNNHRREIVDAWNLPADQHEEFDYLDWAKIEAGEDSASFFQYRDQWYDLGEFTRTEGTLKELGWHGYISDSFWSGICVRYVQDDFDDSVVVASFYTG